MHHESMFDASSGYRAVLRITIAGLTCLGGLTIASPASAQEPCFERLDNGVDFTGWQRSTTNHHGPAAGWTVEDGAMTGRQTAGNLGGIMMTNKSYKDLEVVLEVKIDWGCDSGIFFRTTAGDRAYQVNVDHLTGGGIGTIYGEGFTTELRQRDYTLTNQGNTAIVEPGHTPIFDLAKWSTIWHPTEFNEIRARIEANPPHIQVWISGMKVMDFTDSQLRSEINPDRPPVDSGSRWSRPLGRGRRGEVPQHPREGSHRRVRGADRRWGRTYCRQPTGLERRRSTPLSSRSRQPTPNP